MAIGMDAILIEVMKRRPKAPPFVIGVAGSVAVGKSTFAKALGQGIAALPEAPKVELVSTDGFLFTNAQLGERNLKGRKGFPESFDVEALRSALASIRRREPIHIPLYSHVTYDVDREKAQALGAPDVVILDGLHLGRVEMPGSPRLIDCLVYLDAEEGVIERWFTDRLLPLMESGVGDPKSFYYAYRELDLPGRQAFAARVWANINLPNLRDHIRLDREAADLIVRKAPDHAMVEVVPGPRPA